MSSWTRSLQSSTRTCSPICDQIDLSQHCIWNLRYYIRDSGANLDSVLRATKRFIPDQIKSPDVRADFVGLFELEWGFRYRLENKFLHLRVWRNLLAAAGQTTNGSLKATPIQPTFPPWRTAGDEDVPSSPSPTKFNNMQFRQPCTNGHKHRYLS
jgi:hypothetical protein